MAMINYADKVTLNTNSNIADINKCNASDLNDIKKAFNNQVAFGWYQTGLSPTFTYISWDSSVRTGVVNSNLDLTPYLSVGMKVKFTQNSEIKYAFITAITSTELTLFLGTDYSLNNSTISNSYYSMLKAPFGFPLNPNKWSLVFSDTDTRQQNAPALNVVYNLGNSSLNLPVGNWNVNYGVLIYIVRGTSGTAEATVSLSTSNSAFTDADFSCTVFNNPATAYIVTATKNKTLNITTPTTYYLVITTSNPSGVTYFQFRGSISTTKIIATCAYL